MDSNRSMPPRRQLPFQARHEQGTCKDNGAKGKKGKKGKGKGKKGKGKDKGKAGKGEDWKGKGKGKDKGGKGGGKYSAFEREWGGKGKDGKLKPMACPKGKDCPKLPNCPWPLHLTKEEYAAEKARLNGESTST